MSRLGRALRSTSCQCYCRFYCFQWILHDDDPGIDLAIGSDEGPCTNPDHRSPNRRASAISEWVPYSPSTAITAAAERTTRALRASPRPVGMTTSTQGLAAERSAPGRIPTVVPPADLAPRQAAPMIPMRPPQTTTAPSRARAAPTSSAITSTEAGASPAPMTAIWTGTIDMRDM